jgi:hypothetical protein
VLSPVLCNVYLHRVDRQWAPRGTGVLVRYADDLVVLCHSKREAEAALVSLRSILAELGLELKAAKTGIVDLRDGGEDLDFLGFHHRRVRGERGYRHLRFGQDDRNRSNAEALGAVEGPTPGRSACSAWVREWGRGG